MSDWVALLRGVNVGGITIRSADLVDVFRGLGLTNVRTVLASGNVLFDSANPETELKARIESALEERFGYDAWILLRTPAEIGRVIDEFPFEITPDRQPYAIFCLDGATREELLADAASLDATTDPVARGSGLIYWSPAAGSSTDTTFARAIARKSYRARTTNRNLRTLQKIIA
jgi:uncharacterized protein (DUF1697 family)